MIFQRLTKKGFTLIEMLVAVGIFSLVAFMAVAAILSLNVAQNKAINTQNAYDNIRFALETMVRDVRTGDNYCLDSGDCSLASGAPSFDCAWSSGGCTTFTFKQGLFERKIRYTLVGDVVRKQIVNIITGAIEFDEPLTDPQRTVTAFRVYGWGFGEDFSDVNQERATIVMEVESDVRGRGIESSTFTLQTTVSKRVIW